VPSSPAATVDRFGVGFEAYYADKTQSKMLRGYINSCVKRSMPNMTGIPSTRHSVVDWAFLAGMISIVLTIGPLVMML
jgi:hypothetical protein